MSRQIQNRILIKVVVGRASAMTKGLEMGALEEWCLCCCLSPILTTTNRSGLAPTQKNQIIFFN